MEALVAVGLASNVVQFVEFTAELIKISNELRINAASPENKDYQVITTHLETLAQDISNSAKAISQTSATASQEEKALQPVADRCCELAGSLLKKLNTCGIQPNQDGRRARRVKTAFKCIWNRREIEEISNRLEHFKSELTLHYAFQTRKTQLDLQAQQPRKDDIQAILDKLNGIGISINDTRRSLDDKVNVQHTRLLGCVEELRAQNSQCHTQTAQRAAADQTVLLNRLDGLNASMTALNVGLQSVHAQQSSTFESLSQVRVQNSSFLASISQQVPLAGDGGSSLQLAFRPLFEEYADKIVEGVKKEFRGVARSEMDNFLKSALPTLDEMQCHSTKTQRNPPKTAVEVGPETDSHDIRTGDFNRLDNQAPGRVDKNSITVLYQKVWWMDTRLGQLSFRIRDRVYFNTFGSPTTAYELTAQFIPSPRWFSTGLSITYERRGDARGSPDFGLRLKAYRVLEHGHEVWQAIRDDDISSIQYMLSQKLISTSDRDIYGRTLLHSLQDWKSLCQFVDLDLNIPGGSNFIEQVIFQFSHWESMGPAGLDVPNLLDMITTFDAVVQLKIGSDGSAGTMDIPVAYAASCIYWTLKAAREQSLIADEATPTLSISYRGYYAHPDVATCLNFLEYVISKEIKRRPDCIFDIHNNITASDWLYITWGRHIWEAILEEHGFDVGWVYEENKRRKRVVTGDTSAHEVSVGVDASSIREVTRRRGYKNPSE
ncbi:hypothetical protein F5Y06DRAFT_289188 [Hypoxylon sp. FL0890]|nr:hypothetical protein F5Y06DRAFT_289188 [Hypoxylon sp. FL0890]